MLEQFTFFLKEHYLFNCGHAVLLIHWDWFNGSCPNLEVSGLASFDFNGNKWHFSGAQITIWKTQEQQGFFAETMTQTFLKAGLNVKYVNWAESVNQNKPQNTKFHLVSQ